MNIFIKTSFFHQILIKERLLNTWSLVNYLGGVFNGRLKARNKKRKIPNIKVNKNYNLCRQHNRRQKKTHGKGTNSSKYVATFSSENLYNARILVLPKGLKFITSQRLQNTP